MVKTRIKEHITSRIYEYYPEYKGRNLEVIDTNTMKKQHKSIIYQYDITNSGHVLKSLIVKQRVYNPAYKNDVVGNTAREFENLRSIFALPARRFAVPRAIDALTEEGILITEKVEGRSLYSYLKDAAFLPLPSRKRFLANACFEFGKWLKEFHSSTSNGEKRAIDTEALIGKTKSIRDSLSLYGISQGLTSLLTDKMEQLAHKVADYTYPMASKHGDFQPRNIIWDKEKITVLDLSADNKDLILSDVCHFLAHMYVFNLKYPFSMLSSSTLCSLSEQFLDGYFGHNINNSAGIDIFMCYKFLSLFELTYRRNYSAFSRMRIIMFYNKKIKDFVKGIQND